jgi:Asp-tRNA(Asn)/Glu-tRNA(Gln) amidotransferase A subunit family amidase
MTTPLSSAPTPLASDRRAFLAYFSSMGLGASLLPGVLWGRIAAGAPITKETIAAAEEIAGVTFTDAERAMMLENLTSQREAIDVLHKIPLENSVAPPLLFEPLPPGVTLPAKEHRPLIRERVAMMARPGSLEELAFQPIGRVADLLAKKKVRSLELTEMYIGRIKRLDPKVHSVITLFEDDAIAQAAMADVDFQRGRVRSPLQGIPWAAKDLLAVKGYKTTWGAGPFKDQVIDATATVVERLNAAGAVLLGKFSLGELAQGDMWFGAQTRNPWWLEQGSSGSSAGPAAAVAAGFAAFGIGSETLGSISSPSTRCGVTGLRPTFGRVPRTGAMALAWSMDKIGPIARTAEDCALILSAIHGPDGQDRSVRDYPFNWDATLRPASLRVGYAKSAFDLPERDPASPDKWVHRTRTEDAAALAVLERLGAKLVPVELPKFDLGSATLVLEPEAGAAFENLVLSGKVLDLVQQGPNAWPNTFRSAEFIPAVDYVNANRARALLMKQWWELFREFDVIITPTGAAGQLTMTNLTGNPAVIVPHGFKEALPLAPASPPSPADTSRHTDTTTPTQRPLTPVSLTFLGPLYQEEGPLALAQAFQTVTDFHTRVPPGFGAGS